MNDMIKPAVGRMSEHAPYPFEEVEPLTATLTHEDTSEPRQKLLGRARPTGTGTEGRIALRHEKWLTGGAGTTPR
ncbi:hypothetical protein LG634_13375 [Streptomyces bambusae]|uniref:hypothetical protein n=1 Tax=Streptomyces bambusae TaxID=1550616 RepID=UPI001CFF1282|nr:hypothetical protein [Streptomyces bambusae]MCB5165821.1 hypothetical protein [Streptomyces bambusae]